MRSQTPCPGLDISIGTTCGTSHKNSTSKTGWGVFSVAPKILITFKLYNFCNHFPPEKNKTFLYNGKIKAKITLFMLKHIKGKTTSCPLLKEIKWCTPVM